MSDILRHNLTYGILFSLSPSFLLFISLSLSLPIPLSHSFSHFHELSSHSFSTVYLAWGCVHCAHLVSIFFPFIVSMIFNNLSCKLSQLFLNLCKEHFLNKRQMPNDNRHKIENYKTTRVLYSFVLYIFMKHYPQQPDS